jgi:hypothetical protein
MYRPFLRAAAQRFVMIDEVKFLRDPGQTFVKENKECSEAAQPWRGVIAPLHYEHDAKSSEPVLPVA